MASGFIHARKQIYYLFFAFLLIAVILVIIFFRPTGVGVITLIPSGLEDYLLTQRYFNSNSCFALYDEDIKRTYPKIIDPEKFTKENLDNCYNTKDAIVKAYKLTLKYGSTSKTISTKNWEDLASEAHTEFILVKDDDKIKQGSLSIELQNVQ